MLVLYEKIIYDEKKHYKYINYDKKAWELYPTFGRTKLQKI